MSPQHIAIIPDGNRRWGKDRGGASIGHKRGTENFKKIFRAAFQDKVPYVTFWAASEDNLKRRSRKEVMFLVDLLARTIASKTFEDEMIENKISVRFIGSWNVILRDAKLDRVIHAIEKRTANFKDFHLTILFGYDGKQEMLEAIKDIARQPGRKIDLETIQHAIWTGVLPPVDLVIRTGEEDPGWCHWSAGFMMWQTAQSEFYATKTLWPDFSITEFERTLDEYSRRERRFGK